MPRFTRAARSGQRPEAHRRRARYAVSADVPNQIRRCLFDDQRRRHARCNRIVCAAQAMRTHMQRSEQRASSGAAGSRRAAIDLKRRQACARAQMKMRWRKRKMPKRQKRSHEPARARRGECKDMAARRRNAPLRCGKSSWQRAERWHDEQTVMRCGEAGAAKDDAQVHNEACA